METANSMYMVVSWEGLGDSGMMWYPPASNSLQHLVSAAKPSEKFWKQLVDGPVAMLHRHVHTRPTKYGRGGKNPQKRVFPLSLSLNSARYLVQFLTSLQPGVLW
jgi:hypothetical protein